MNRFVRFTIRGIEGGSWCARLLAWFVTIGSPTIGVFGADSGGSPPPPPSSSPAPYINALQTRPMTGEETRKINDAGLEHMSDRAAAERPRKIVFPANPPPLGAQINSNRDSAIPADPAIEALLGETLEPYFAPLSTRIIEPDFALNGRMRARLQNYRDSRLRLLTALRDRVAGLASADAETRRQEFSALALVQKAELEKLEAEAEKLRDEFARNVSWFAKRKWRLGKGELNKPREQLRVFEYQVLRAAAFYQDGLSPAQRRLVREAAQLVEGSVFAEAETPAAAPLLFFFSPDLLRMQFPARISPEVASLFRHYAAAKDALREELRNVLYEGETAGDGSRIRKLRRLATDHEPQFAALEELADSIRERLAASSSSWRQPPPQQLPAGLEEQIAEYVTTKRKVLMDYLAVMRSVAKTRGPAVTRNDSKPPDASEERRQQRIEQAKKEYLAKQSATMQHLGRLLQDICARLPSFLTAQEVLTAGISDDAQLLEFLRRHRQEQAYYEYDIAAFEPGLSPAQRRLLFAGAVGRLELPFVGPDLQPTTLPKTLVR